MQNLFALRSNISFLKGRSYSSEHNSFQAELKGKILNGRISLIYRVDGYE